jgi:hypothetical protein
LQYGHHEADRKNTTMAPFGPEIDRNVRVVPD